MTEPDGIIEEIKAFEEETAEEPVESPSTPEAEIPSASNEVFLISDKEWDKESAEFLEEHKELVDEAKKISPVYVVKFIDGIGEHKCIIRGLTRKEYMLSQNLFHPIMKHGQEKLDAMTETERLIIGIETAQEQQDYTIRVGTVYCSTVGGTISENVQLESIMTAGTATQLYENILAISGFEIEQKQLKKA